MVARSRPWFPRAKLETVAAPAAPAGLPAECQIELHLARLQTIRSKPKVDHSFTPTRRYCQSDRDEEEPW